MAKKQIFLPAWVKPMAHLHADTAAQDECGFKKGSKEYDREYKKAFILFCKEFHTDSLTPKIANPLSANPTWRGGINAFAEFEDVLFTGSDSFLSKRTGTPEERKAMSKILRRSITNIVSVYLKAEMKSDKYGYNQISSKSETKNAELMAAQKHRYERLIVISMLLSFVEMIFKTKKEALSATVELALKGKSWKELSTTLSHRAFSQGVRQALHDDLEASEPLELVKNYLESKDWIKEFK